jgi:hypothetical protein
VAKSVHPFPTIASIGIEIFSGLAKTLKASGNVTHSSLGSIVNGFEASSIFVAASLYLYNPKLGLIPVFGSVITAFL